MGNRLYVGNLSFQVTEEELTSLFEEYGQVTSVKIVTDRETGRKRGFAFVDLSTDGEAQKALENLDGKEFLGRPLKISEARENPNRGKGGPRGFNRGRDHGHSHPHSHDNRPSRPRPTDNKIKKFKKDDDDDDDLD